MSQTIIAMYEEGVFKPSEPLDLSPQTIVELTINELPGKSDSMPSKDQVLARMK